MFLLLDIPSSSYGLCGAEEQQEELDSELLLKKCDLLEKEGLIEEFIDTVRTLLSQHCPIIRSRDEAKCESAAAPLSWQDRQRNH